MNTTTLNMTTLDGNVIIKKGGGGGVTINNQDKVVDITENGTTEVVADGGFTGLGKVTINTEVSGGESGESTIEYFDVSGFNVENDDELSLKEALILISVVVKIPKSFNVTVDMPTGTGGRTDYFERGIEAGAKFASNMGQYNWDNYKVAKKQTVNGVSGVAVDFSQLMTFDGNIMDIQEIITLAGLTEIIDSLPRITKEQFYSLD